MISSLDEFLEEAERWVKLEGFYWEPPEIKIRNAETQVSFSRIRPTHAGFFFSAEPDESMSVECKLSLIMDIIDFHKGQPPKINSWLP